MSAVWRASRAAVRRRRLQTTVIALVGFCSSAAIVVALGLLDAASAPFDRTFAEQRGAHVVAAFDSAQVSDTRLAQTARRPGVEAAAGPFAQAVLTVPDSREKPASGEATSFLSGPLTVVGRADPAGPVDRVNLWSGRWATTPGEIVLNEPPGRGSNVPLGSRLEVPGAPPLTVVGFASSLSGSADAWVSPEQITALHPTATQMLYRFTRSATDSQIRAALAAATAGLPSRALLASQSYLSVKQDLSRVANAYLPYLAAFAVLGLVVAVLIVANVVSGAVVAGFRHIGILKALGFTPNQVVAVYLVMVLVPGAVGTMLGTVVGDVAARPLLHMVFSGFRSGMFTVELSPWMDVVTVLGTPVVVVLAALAPALRAHRLSAVRAISAGSAPRTGRGLRVQRTLSGTPLPRPVSLGLGLPFARPGRTVMTLAAVTLGVTAVTFATGLTATMTVYGDMTKPKAQSAVYVGQPRFGQTARTHDDAGTEALLRSLPGAVHVTANAWIGVGLVEDNKSIMCQFLRGDTETYPGTIIEGRWMRGRGEVVAPTPFLRKRGLKVGDHLTLTMGDRRETVTIVGAEWTGDPDLLQASWPTLEALAPEQAANQYYVQLAPGVDVSAYNAAVRAADPGLYPRVPDQQNTDVVAIVTSASVLTLLLATVAALGVFNTVVLNTRERRRDLGMLKSIGMTPRQVTVMVVTSMAALGVVGGLLGVSIGIVAHHLTIPAMTDAAGFTLPADVWHAPGLALLALAGVMIAVLGAFVPARSAARLTIAEVLHNE